MNETPDAIRRDILAVSRISAVPTILDVICRTTGMGFAAVARVSDGTWTACAVKDDIAFGLQPGGQLEVHTTLCREVREARRAIVIDHVAQDATYCDHHTPRQYGFQSYISVPIVLRDGEYFGNLCAIDPRPAALSGKGTVEMFSLFADLIARQLESEREHMATGAALVSERATAELREQFIAVLGHDLRNPLAAVRTVGEMLQVAGPTLDLPLLGRRLVGSTRRMSSLIDDVLDFARGRLGTGMVLRKARTDALDLLLSNVIAELTIIHPGREVAWRVDIPGPLRCDAARVQQLLSNLVANALVHGTADRPVTASAVSDNDTLVIEVANAGRPIPPEQLPRVFEPYWRGSTSDSEGLGLGLYICAQIVRAHGGTLDVASTEEHGTRFVARLPCL